MKRYLTIFAIAISSFTCNAGAALLDHGSFTTDSSTGLDWLDLTATKGYSYNYVVSQLGSGGLFEGWSVANGDQLSGLFDSAGGSGGYFGTSAANNSMANTLLPLWGSTVVTAGGNPKANFLTAASVNATQQWYGTLYNDGSATVYIYYDYWNKTIGLPQFATALVRESPLPIPGAIWLLGSGLIALSLNRRQRSEASQDECS